MAIIWDLEPLEVLPQPESLPGRLLSFPHLVSDFLPDTMSGELPPFPLLPATRLQLELLLSERLIDLDALCQVVLSDPGAALSVMRVAGTQGGLAPDSSSRMEDWVACLDLAEWFALAAEAPVLCTGELSAAWRHARLVALHARALAAPADWCCPEQAYLAALLHELGTIPELLDWATPDCSASERHISMARVLCLPQFLTYFFREQENPSSAWAAILANAHRLAIVADKVA